jgi:hypothetical protein
MTLSRRPGVTVGSAWMAGRHSAARGHWLGACAGRDGGVSGSARASERPAPRSSPTPDPPPAAGAAPAPAAHHPSPHAPRPNAPPSCDRTRPEPPPGGTSRSSHTPQGSPSLPPVSSRPASRSRVDNNTRRSTDASGQNREEKTWPPMGRNRGHQWGDSVAAYGELSMAAVSSRSS